MERLIMRAPSAPQPCIKLLKIAPTPNAVMSFAQQRSVAIEDKSIVASRPLFR
jgi:hypothetical protein